MSVSEPDPILFPVFGENLGQKSLRHSSGWRQQVNQDEATSRVYIVEDDDDSISHHAQDHDCFTDVLNNAIDYNSWSFKNRRCCKYYAKWDYDDYNRARTNEAGAIGKPSSDHKYYDYYQRGHLGNHQTKDPFFANDVTNDDNNNAIRNDISHNRNVYHHANDYTIGAY
ncbi:hypothetical protein AAVH_17881 [Aphelenchoides avenae]|nr:hypothetical protein AAVH_17881 [Aphelenchus avenae]